MAKSEKNQRKLTTIYVTPVGLQRMNKLAQEFGYYQTRGAGAGKMGSISQLIEAIAQGELTLHRPGDSQEMSLNIQP